MPVPAPVPPTFTGLLSGAQWGIHQARAELRGEYGEPSAANASAAVVRTSHRIGEAIELGAPSGALDAARAAAGDHGRRGAGARRRRRLDRRGARARRGGLTACGTRRVRTRPPRRCAGTAPRRIARTG